MNLHAVSQVGCSNENVMEDCHSQSDIYLGGTAIIKPIGVTHFLLVTE